MTYSGFQVQDPNISKASKRLTTILFTDIVNSTQKMLAIGDREWALKIQNHDKIVLDIVSNYNGEVLKNTGDGCLCVCLTVLFVRPNVQLVCAKL